MHSEWSKTHWLVPYKEQRTAGRIHWKAPLPCQYTCNIDMAVLANGSYSLGMIIQDSQEMCCTGCLTQPSFYDPQLREALDFWKVLSWIKTFSFFPIHMETDCLVVVQALKAEVLSDFSYCSFLIFNCKVPLNELQYVSYEFIRKSANVVAHIIARAVNSILDFEWICPPYFLYDILTFHLNNIH